MDFEISLLEGKISDLKAEVERLRSALREIEDAPWDTEMIAIARKALEERDGTAERTRTVPE